MGAGTLETVLGAGSSGSGRARPKGATWWARSDVKRICEWLFGTGQLTTGGAGSDACLNGETVRRCP